MERSAQEDAAAAVGSQVPIAPQVEPVPEEPAPPPSLPSSQAFSTISDSADSGAVVTVTSQPIIPPPSVVESAHQSGHVIRLHVKSTTLLYYLFGLRRSCKQCFLFHISEILKFK